LAACSSVRFDGAESLPRGSALNASARHCFAAAFAPFPANVLKIF
jgi:hypothetical protein